MLLKGALCSSRKSLKSLYSEEGISILFQQSQKAIKREG
jgi:hypothetical protein